MRDHSSAVVRFSLTEPERSCRSLKSRNNNNMKKKKTTKPTPKIFRAGTIRRGMRKTKKATIRCELELRQQQGMQSAWVYCFLYFVEESKEHSKHFQRVYLGQYSFMLVRWCCLYNNADRACARTARMWELLSEHMETASPSVCKKRKPLCT